jgi:iron-sulfur cluster assembly protein
MLGRSIPALDLVRYAGGKAEMIQLTDNAVSKINEILGQQEPKPQGLRISVVGGGCSGFQYSMAFENSQLPLDKVYKFNGDLNVFVDQASMLYLKDVRVDYVETLEGAGFKFENPNVTSTCGCGSSFNA